MLSKFMQGYTERSSAIPSYAEELASTDEPSAADISIDDTQQKDRSVVDSLVETPTEPCVEPPSVNITVVDSLVKTLTDYCVEPPSVDITQSDCTISCIWRPLELNYDHDVDFSCTVEKRGGSDVITAVKFSMSSKLPDVTVTQTESLSGL